MGPFDFVRSRPWQLLVYAVGIALVAGFVFGGPNFLAQRIPLPGPLATIWMVFNSAFEILVAVLIYRRLHHHPSALTEQEMNFVRGVMWVLVGGSLGYLSRILTQGGSVSLGTPGVTLGIVVILYAMVRPLVRAEAAREARKNPRVEEEAI